MNMNIVKLFDQRLHLRGEGGREIHQIPLTWIEILDNR